MKNQAQWHAEQCTESELIVSFKKKINYSHYTVQSAFILEVNTERPVSIQQQPIGLDLKLKRLLETSENILINDAVCEH